jgi:hypothetical protein
MDKKYRIDHYDDLNKRRKEWRNNNKDITRDRDKRYREKMKSRKAEDIVVPGIKKCSNCEKTMISDEFFRDRTSKDGLNIYCKACTKIKHQKSYQKHKEKIKIDGKKYREKNKEKIFKRQQLYYQKNKSRIQEYKREYRIKNIEKIEAKRKIYNSTHKEHIKKYFRNRRKNNLDYRILNNLRGRLYYALKSQGSMKIMSTIDLVGCSVDELKLHIQKQFKNKMTFDNYGIGLNKWSIDHIIPCAYFDLTKTEEQKKCFHYTNLMPLWNRDNFKKNSMYNGRYIRKKRKTNYV